MNKKGKEKKKIILLAFVILIITLFIAAIDATMTAFNFYGVPDKEIEAKNFIEFWQKCPIWWKIVPIMVFFSASVPIAWFRIKNGKSSIKLHELGLLYLIPTISFNFVIFDLTSALIIEQLRGNVFTIFGEMYQSWWWLQYWPIPRFVSFIFGHGYPNLLDVTITCLIGVVVIVALLAIYYYRKL